MDSESLVILAGLNENDNLFEIDLYFKKAKAMKIKQLLLVVLVFSTLGQIYAQTDFRAGYVIKSNNDTLIGEIDYRGDILMGEKCRFRLNDKEKETIFSPDDIIGYRFNDSKYFVSKEVNSKKVFLEFLIKGQISIYYLRDNKGDHYFLDKEDNKLIEIPYEEGIRYIDSTPYLYNSTKHIGLLIYYMQDAPEFQSRIANMGKPEHESLIKLAEDYHNKVCKDRACIIYEKKLPVFKFYLEIIGGIANYQNTDFNDKNYFQAGIVANLWMPRTSEKLYFRTGMLYSTLEENSESEAMYKIPIQIEYIYPKGIVRPKMAFGLNILHLYGELYHSVALMGGVNIKLNKSVYISVDYDNDFIPNDKYPLLPKSILSKSISTGLLIKL